MIAAILAASLYSIPTGFGSVSMAHQPESGVVCSQPPQGLVEWEHLALQTLGAEKVQNPGVDLLKNNHPEVGIHSLLRFETAATPSLTERHWSLVYEGGVMEFQPQLLKGNVAWVVDDNYSIIDGPMFYGDMCSHVSFSRPQAAFVLEGKTGKWSAHPAGPVTHAGEHYTFHWKNRELPITHPSFWSGPQKTVEKPLEVGNAVVMNGSNGSTLALVIWNSHVMCGEGCCENAYSLYEITASGDIRPALESAYNCDI